MRLFLANLFLLSSLVSSAQQINPQQIRGTAIVQSPSDSQTISHPMISPLWTGMNLFPHITDPITTTGNPTKGSATFMVANPTGVAVGMQITANFAATCQLPIGAFTIPEVTNISGSSITMSCPAISSTPGKVTFGALRTDPSAAVVVNSVATKWLLVGGATQGNSMIGGLSDPNNMNMQVQGYGNSLGALFYANTSDMTSGSGTRPLNVAVTADSFHAGRNKDSWGAYFQSNLLPSADNQSQHLQMEMSINNNWSAPSPIEDPFQVNNINNAINQRLDCGTGQPLDDPSSPNKCTTAIEILQNGARYYNGIIVGNQALDTSSGRIAPALALPPNTAVTWFISQGNNPGKIYSDTSGNIILQSNGLKVNRVGNGAGLQNVTTNRTCTPANTALASCSVTVNFLQAEPDNAYSYACTLDAVNAFLGSVSNRTMTGFDVVILATGKGVPAVSQISCTITHN